MAEKLNNVKNHLSRVGDKFNKEVERINEKRKNSGKKKLSIRFITDKIIKHNSWPIMRQDFIDFDLEDFKNGDNEN